MIQSLKVIEWAKYPIRSSLLLAALLAAVGVAKYGLGMWPGWENLYQVAVNWQSPTSGSLVQPPQDYILANAIPNVFLGALRLDSRPVYVSIQVVLALVAIAIPFVMPVVRESIQTSRLTFAMLAGGPALALLLSWVGGYDAICVIGATLAVLARNSWTSAAGWFIFALGHSTLSIVTFVCWVLLICAGGLISQGRDSIRRSFFAAVGIALGSTAVWAMTESWGGVTSRFEAFRLYTPDYYINAWIAGMPMILFSALGVGWIIFLDKSLRRTRPVRVLLLITVLLSFTLPLLVLDETRTLALVMTPLTLAWVSSARRLHGVETINLVWRRYGVAAAIIPITVVWSGQFLPMGFQSILHWRANF